MSAVLAVGVTAVLYLALDRLADRLGRPAYVVPVLWAPLALVGMLSLVHVEVVDYLREVRPLKWLLGPATVALGAPLARVLRGFSSTRQAVRVLSATLLGGLAASLTAVGVAVAFGASNDVVGVVASKSVTAPIAVTMRLSIGGNDGLLAASCVLAGVYGAVALPVLARWTRLDDPVSLGTGVGVAAHAIGAASLGQRNPDAVGWAAAGLALNGVFTALWLPPLIGPLMHWIG